MPRLRTMAHGEYLNAGLAYQFHAHRDTWFSAPHQQLNWWLPVYAIESENSMAFHPQYFDATDPEQLLGLRLRGVEQDRPPAGREAGHEGDAQAAAGRGAARARCRTCASSRPPGGTIVFSAAHLHSTVPNTTNRTRFSIDFRTVNIDDLVEGVGAPNIDSECTGTTLRDFLRASDLEPLPEDVIAKYDRRPIASVA